MPVGNRCDLGRGSPGVPSLGKLFDHLSVERRNIVRFATRNQSVIYDDSLIDPVCACVAHIDLNCRPRSHLSAANKIRADQDLRFMTYDCHRFVLPEKMLRKLKRVLI